VVSLLTELESCGESNHSALAFQLRKCPALQHRQSASKLYRAVWVRVLQKSGKAEESAGDNKETTVTIKQ